MSHLQMPLLLFVGPNKIKKVIREMEHVACKALVFNEWLGEDRKFLWHDGHCIHDYKVGFTEYFSTDSNKISRLEKDLCVGWELFGAMLEVRL